MIRSFDRYMSDHICDQSARSIYHSSSICCIVARSSCITCFISDLGAGSAYFESSPACLTRAICLFVSVTTLPSFIMKAGHPRDHLSQGMPSESALALQSMSTVLPEDTVPDMFRLAHEADFKIFAEQCRLSQGIGSCSYSLGEGNCTYAASIVVTSLLYNVISLRPVPI